MHLGTHAAGPLVSKPSEQEPESGAQSFGTERLTIVTLILGFSGFFGFLLTENRCVPIDSDATIGSVVATWVVSKTLKKKVRVRSGLVDQN